MSHQKSNEDTVAVLGGGLAGLSAMYFLRQAGYQNSHLFEKEKRVGGVTRSEKVNGFTFDFTGHLLHFKNEEVKSLVSTLLGDNLHYLHRNSWIFSKDCYTRYPFQTNLYGLPPEVIKECIVGFIKATGNGSAPRVSLPSHTNGYATFADWIAETLGEGISKHFMTPYNQKLWTIPLQELTCEWMGRFVPQTSLEQILDGALRDQSARQGYNAQFGYPLRGGIESLPRAFAANLSNLHVDHELTELDPVKKRLKFKNGAHLKYDRLISSIPLPILIRSINHPPASVDRACSRLRSVSVYNLNLGIDRNPGDKHWIYFPESQYCFYRVGFSHNFSPYQAPEGKGAIYVEVAHSKWKPLDRSSIVRQIKQDLLSCGILQKDDVIAAELPLDIPCAYVLFDQHYRESVDVIRAYARENGITTIGRYGSWEYSGMEDAIWQGQCAAREAVG
ncbi:MAG: FAD-dependent oxidoreductase [Terriglobia bacterium]